MGRVPLIPSEEEIMHYLENRGEVEARHIINDFSRYDKAAVYLQLDKLVEEGRIEEHKRKELVRSGDLTIESFSPTTYNLYGNNGSSS